MLVKLTLWSPLVTLKDRLTWVAGSYVELPAWSASIVQVPTVRRVTVVPLVPDTVQTSVVAEVKLTASPDGEAVAATVKGDWSRRRSERVSKVMVWLWPPTVIDCWAGVATFQLVSPAWVALMRQMPTAVKSTTPPALRVQPLEAASRAMSGSRPLVALAAGV